MSDYVELHVTECSLGALKHLLTVIEEQYDVDDESTVIALGKERPESYRDREHMWVRIATGETEATRV